MEKNYTVKTNKKTWNKKSKWINEQIKIYKQQWPETAKLQKKEETKRRNKLQNKKGIEFKKSVKIAKQQPKIAALKLQNRSL